MGGAEDEDNVFSFMVKRSADALDVLTTDWDWDGAEVKYSGTFQENYWSFYFTINPFANVLNSDLLVAVMDNTVYRHCIDHFIRLIIKKAIPLPLSSFRSAEAGKSSKILNKVFDERHANTMSNISVRATPATRAISAPVEIS